MEPPRQKPHAMPSGTSFFFFSGSNFLPIAHSAQRGFSPSRLGTSSAPPDRNGLIGGGGIPLFKASSWLLFSFGAFCQTEGFSLTPLKVKLLPGEHKATEVGIVQGYLEIQASNACVYLGALCAFGDSEERHGGTFVWGVPCLTP